MILILRVDHQYIMQHNELCVHCEYTNCWLCCSGT